MMSCTDFFEVLNCICTM